MSSTISCPPSIENDEKLVDTLVKVKPNKQEKAQISTSQTLLVAADMQPPGGYIVKDRNNITCNKHNIKITKYWKQAIP